MAQITLPRDTIGFAVQALSPRTGTNVNVAVAAASARGAIPTNCDVVRIATNTDCYVLFGDNTVVATNLCMFFPAGSEVFRIPTGTTNVAFIRSSADGTASITAME
jgi:hypothetical protein